MVNKKRLVVFGMLAGAIAMLLVAMIFFPIGLISLAFWLPFMALVLGSIAGYFILRLDRTWTQLPESVVAALMEEEDAGVVSTSQAPLPKKKPPEKAKQKIYTPSIGETKGASTKQVQEKTTSATEFAKTMAMKKQEVDNNPEPIAKVTPPAAPASQAPATAPFSAASGPELPATEGEDNSTIINVKKGKVSRKVVFLIIEAYKEVGIKSFSLSRIRRDLGVNGEKNVEKLVGFLQDALAYDVIYKRGNKFTVL